MDEKKRREFIDAVWRMRVVHEVSNAVVGEQNTFRTHAESFALAEQRLFALLDTYKLPAERACVVALARAYRRAVCAALRGDTRYVAPGVDAARDTLFSFVEETEVEWALTKTVRTDSAQMVELLLRMGFARGAVLYQILLRQAGWAVQWSEMGRAVTPEVAPPSNDICNAPLTSRTRCPGVLELVKDEGGARHCSACGHTIQHTDWSYRDHRARKKQDDARRKRVCESKVVYDYYPTFTAMAEGEMRRLTSNRAEDVCVDMPAAPRVK